MPVKYRQAAQAALELVRDPYDFPPAVRLAEAVADAWIIKTLYHRMVGALSYAEREHLRELTRRPIDLPALRELPPETFGKTYADFLDRHGLSPTAQVDAWPPIAEVFARDWIALRFARIHDMHHALLGFGADPHGEMGLQVFNLRNFREPFATLALASLPVTLFRYGDTPRMVREIRRGWGLGASTANLFHVPFEDLFAEDVEALRRRLGIEPAAVA